MLAMNHMLEDILKPGSLQRTIAIKLFSVDFFECDAQLFRMFHLWEKVGSL